jgi:hypothetical protein
MDEQHVIPVFCITSIVMGAPIVIELVSRLDAIAQTGQTAEALADFDRHGGEEIAQILMCITRDSFSPELSAKIFAAIPGGEEMADKAELGSDTPMSGIGGMMFLAMKNVLGVADPIVSAVTELKSAGLSSHQALETGVIFMTFVRERAGSEIVAEMIEEIPGLGRLSAPAEAVEQDAEISA